MGTCLHFPEHECAGAELLLELRQPTSLLLVPDQELLSLADGVSHCSDGCHQGLGRAVRSLQRHLGGREGNREEAEHPLSHPARASPVPHSFLRDSLISGNSERALQR